MTETEYLEGEIVAEVRSEYLHGRITMMPGVSRSHEKVDRRLATRLDLHTVETGCESYGSNVKVRIPNAGYLYPDASYACDPLFEGEYVLLNPIAVFEILSPSTEARDLGVKFDAYRTISSLQTYVLFRTDRALALVYERADEGWVLTEHAGREASLPLPTIGLTLAMDDLYARLPDAL